MAAPKKKAAPKSKSKAGTSRVSAEQRRKLFIEAYIANGGNATDAARKAGYAESSAHVRGAELVKDRKVQSDIAARQTELAKKFELTTEDVIAELAKIVRVDLRRLFDSSGNLLPVNEWPDDVAGAVASFEVDEIHEGQGEARKFVGYTRKVKLWDKNSAIEKAMKHLGLFEADNKQRNPFEGLPRDVVKLIAERLKNVAKS